MERIEPDWALWRSFAAVVEYGSLSAAARTIGLSQPTIGRHIEALEQQLRTNLFDRALRGLTPTETALHLYERVVVASKALAEATMVAEGANVDLAGTVRITASEITANYSLPPILYKLRQEYPAIDIELVPSDSPENLLMHEADIAVRMFRPTQLELIAKKISESPLSCCAHENYLKANGTPKSPADILNHNMVGFDRSDMIISHARKLGYDINRKDFQIRSDSQTVIWELVKAGLGLGFAQDILIKTTAGMVAVLPDFDIPPLEVWLTTHRELFTSQRIRAIYDRLGELLTTYYAMTD